MVLNTFIIISLGNHTDHQPLVQLSIKPLAELSPRLQHLFLRVNHYKYTVKYVRQTRVMIADCLSHIVCQDTAEDIPRWETARYLSSNLTGSTTGLSLPVIQNGWGESRRELDADLHAFWIHRFNMHITNGIIMNGS